MNAGHQSFKMMTSPIHFSCFYENTDPSYSTTYSTGDQRPSSKWNNAACLNETINHLNKFDDETAMESGSPLWYQELCVKNPVNAPIIQEHSDNMLWSRAHDNIQVLEHLDTNYTNHPGLTVALQKGKRPVDDVMYPFPCPKRPASLYNSVQTPYSSDMLKDDSSCPEPCWCVADKILPMEESVTLSLTAVQIPEISSQTVPLCGTMPPYMGIPTVTSVSPLYPATNPGNNPTLPFIPQPDPTPPSPLPPLCFDASNGEAMSLFQWQIKQEEEKLAGLPPEQLVVQDCDGDTFLHIAVAQGRRALAYVLATKMAQINMLDLKDHNGQSALQVSVAANQYLIVQDLITLGAQISTADSWGRSPLHVCAEKGHVQTLQAIQRAMQAIGKQVDLETVNYDGQTALHTAVLSHNSVVQVMQLEAKQHPPLMMTLVPRIKLLKDCISTLLLMGASYKTKDHKSGHTALHMAAEAANVDLLRLFLDQPDSLTIVNDKAYNGNTALHLVSALTGRVAQADAVKLLLRQGADPSIKNLEKEQPSQLVPEGPMGDLVQRFLKGKGVPTRPSLRTPSV
ncbi:hypothetical protein AGOR_G00064110 [Albula goreensis]|uniref:NF-kappa-B inhibitor zeta n=1 Tax=Albula goreensis TaxID=1534307 RepID=A0A8T3DV07_9TELE|nr:hypothetical protein AGOR_G00064110 [Albula goreensis]